ncbi:MAG: glycosyltransferase family 9 protein [Proteobacteria bacterium]|nr:glycosyltransferase family 9 protein [Pseudomonadota bacterium]
MAQKILLIQLRQLGDILLTTPCIREIKRAWPDAELSFLTHPMGRLVLDGNPYLKQLLCYDPKGTWRQDWQLIKKLRSESFDLVLDFMYNPRSAMYARLSGAPRRLAFASRRSWLFTEQLAQGSAVEYIVSEKFRYLRALGLEPKALQLDLPWHQEHLAPVMQMIREDALFAEAPLRIALSPTHRRLERQWSQQNYAAIADRLVKEWGAAVTWVWGPGEEQFIRQIMEQCQQPTQMAPKTSFRELAAFLAQCDLFIGNSNGPSHVAVAVDIASLQLHGPTYAAAWSPLTLRHRAIQAGRHLAGGRGPISGISQAEVWTILQDMQPDLLKSAESRRAIGVRMGWSPLF